MLVKRHLRAILELKPKAFVMENVSMLKSEVHRFYMEKADVDIVKQYEIPVKVIQLSSLYEQYIFEGVLDTLQDPQQITMYIWEENNYYESNVIYKKSKNIAKLKGACGRKVGLHSI